MKNLLTIILCCFFLNQLAAQNWKTFTYHKIALDIEKEGNTLWIATSGGLINWDLQTNTYYKLTTEDGLIGNRINAIAIDSEGRKWLATNRGVSMVDGSNIVSYNVDDGLYTDNVNSVVIDSDDNKWFATRSDDGKSGVSKLDNQGNWSTIPESILFAPLCLAIDAADNIYIGSYKKIAKYNVIDGWSIFLPASAESIGWIGEMAIDENQELWAVSGDGLFHYDSNANQTVFDVNQGLASNPRSLYIDSDQNKWVGTDVGFSRFNADSTFSNFNLGIQVQTIFEDDENLLLGTVRDVRSFDGNNYTPLSTDVDLRGEHVRGIDIAADGSVWMGTGQGVSKFNSDKTWTNFDHDDGLVCNASYAVLATSQQGLLVSHKANCSGVSTIDIPTGNVSFFQSDTFHFTLSMNEDLSGNIWLGYYAPPAFNNRYTAKILPTGEVKFFDFTTVLPNTSNNKTTGVAIHPNGDVYFSTRYGIYFIDANDEIQLFQAGVPASTIFIDSQENIWIGEGDYFGPNQTLEKYTAGGDHIIYQNNEINDFKINEIIEDDQQNIWIASENGLFKLTPDGNFSRYSTLDGLADNDVTGIEFDHNGKMWVSTMNGVSTTADLSTSTANINESEIEIQLYPNPILATATLDFSLDKNELVKVEIYNVAGQLLSTPFAGEKWRGNHQVEFQLDNFSRGVYFCKVKIGGRSEVIKFIKM